MDNAFDIIRRVFPEFHRAFAELWALRKSDKKLFWSELGGGLGFLVVLILGISMLGGFS